MLGIKHKNKSSKIIHTVTKVTKERDTITHNTQKRKKKKRKRNEQSMNLFHEIPSKSKIWRNECHVSNQHNVRIV